MVLDRCLPVCTFYGGLWVRKNKRFLHEAEKDNLLYDGGVSMFDCKITQMESNVGFKISLKISCQNLHVVTLTAAVYIVVLAFSMKMCWPWVGFGMSGWGECLGLELGLGLGVGYGLGPGLSRA